MGLAAQTTEILKYLLYLNALDVICDVLMCLWQLNKVDVPKLDVH